MSVFSRRPPTIDARFAKPLDDPANAGIRAALEAGLLPVKVNAVIYFRVVDQERAFAVGLMTVAQFSFWGNYLPRVYPTHLRGTGEGFAANVGGRMIGTSAALLAQAEAGAQDRHQHLLLAVVGELVDHVRAVVDQPHVLLGVVGVDEDAVRPHELVVVLAPRLHDVAVAVEHQQAVLPARLRARWPRFRAR